MRLPISGWAVRLGRGADDRPALEVYAGTRMVDVCVATPVSMSVLRGAWRSPRGEVPWAVAWGQLPAGVTEVTAAFGRNRVPAVLVEGAYWVAEAAGEYGQITVHAGAAQVGTRLRRSRF